jgi:hypothetical protein
LSFVDATKVIATEFSGVVIFVAFLVSAFGSECGFLRAPNVMLSLEQMLKIDPSLADLSEEELRELQASLYETAQLAFDVYWRKKCGSKNPAGLLPKKKVDPTL